MMIKMEMGKSEKKKDKGNEMEKRMVEKGYEGKERERKEREREREIERTKN